MFKFVGIDEINYAGSHGMDIKLSTATASASNDIVDKFYCLFFISIRLIYKFVDM